MFYKELKRYSDLFSAQFVSFVQKQTIIGMLHPDPKYCSHVELCGVRISSESKVADLPFMKNAASLTS